MKEQGQLAASRMIDSLTGWWELAGVDAAVSDTPVDWLEIDARPNQPNPAPAAPPFEKTSPVKTADPCVEWPTDIDALKAMISNGAALPGNGFSSRFVTPVGLGGSEVMIVSDLPDQDEISIGKLGAGASGALLERMMTAIGIRLSDCYWTALATTIPPTGEVPEAAHGELANFVRHQISMVGPKSILLLGSAACKALLNDDLMKARAQLRNFNHDGSNMAAVTTFHPRTLIARSALKAQAWKDLQMFAKRADL